MTEGPQRSTRYQALIAIIALVTAAATLATAGVGLYVVIEAKQDIQDTKRDVQEIHIIMNSRMDELLEETRKNARAEGVIEGESN